MTIHFMLDTEINVSLACHYNTQRIQSNLIKCTVFGLMREEETFTYCNEFFEGLTKDVTSKSKSKLSFQVQ